MIFTTFGFSLVLAWGLCPLLQKIAPSIGLVDAPDRPRKKHSHPIPLVGGLAIWISVTITLALTMESMNPILWMAMTGMGLVGLLDDIFELSAFPKLALQIFIASLLWYANMRVTLFIPYPWTSFLFTVLWFVWVVNALNFIDNTNGLCGGVAAITLGGLAVIHLQFTQVPHLEVWDLTLLGSIIGFLLWNFPRARVFLGDSGSHLIGGAVAGIMVQTTFVRADRGEASIAILPILFLILMPLVDFLQVTLRRIRKGQPIWQGDTNHLSHLLISQGFTPTQAVLILWGFTLISTALAIFVWRVSL